MLLRLLPEETANDCDRDCYYRRLQASATVSVCNCCCKSKPPLPPIMIDTLGVSTASGSYSVAGTLVLH